MNTTESPDGIIEGESMIRRGGISPWDATLRGSTVVFVWAWDWWRVDEIAFVICYGELLRDR